MHVDQAVQEDRCGSPLRMAWEPPEGAEQGRGRGQAQALIPVPLTPGETRRILSVQPTYDWTCFSHSLLNVSPMPVESSPPLPCPTPCHLLPNCTSCLDSKGADGGWQHCVWSSSLQQVPSGGVPRGPSPPCPCPSVLLPLPFPWLWSLHGASSVLLPLFSSPTSTSSFPAGLSSLPLASARTLPPRHLPDPTARVTVPPHPSRDC